jgi:predicted DNA-binding transcriptional regulator AlpA
MQIADEKTRERVLFTEEVQAMVGRRKTAFCALLADPKAGFPRPIKIHKRKHGFLESEVIEWLRQQPRVEPSKPPGKLFNRLAGLTAGRIRQSAQRRADRDSSSQEVGGMVPSAAEAAR